MPFPIAAIGAAGSAAGNNMNALGQMGMNFINQQQARSDYKRQRADNLEFWHMQNEYNSPQAQMKRFQEAGLNPMLIYGQGNNASPISTPDMQHTQHRDPQIGNAAMEGLPAISAMYDIEIKQATIDNLKTQNEVLQKERDLKASQIPLTTTNAERAKFNLDFESELRDVSADARRENLRQTRTSIDLAINEDIRRAAINASSLQEAAERMLTMQQQRTVIPYQKRQMTAETARSYEAIRQMIKDGTLKDLDIELRQMRINPNDPMYARIIGGILQGIVEDPQSLQKAKEGILPYIPNIGSMSKQWWKQLSGQ